MYSVKALSGKNTKHRHKGYSATRQSDHCSLFEFICQCIQHRLLEKTQKEIYHGNKNYHPSPEFYHRCQKGKYSICFLVQFAHTKKEVIGIAVWAENL